MVSFGPVSSRRLGKSLGINNIPSQKICSYSCIYCQVGETRAMSFNREVFFDPDFIFKEVQKHLRKLKEVDKPDYLTFVANGEPTLDLNLGKSIIKLKEFNIPIAVITNASLLSRQEVRDDLCLADWVSIKIDTSDESTWRKINRPLHALDFKNHVQGILRFVSQYSGKLMTETMLVQGVNDSTSLLNDTARFISQVKPSVAYLSIPTRPPALPFVKVPDETIINQAYQVFSGKDLKVELLTGFEGSDTGYTGNVIEDIINICTVHPIREDTMGKLLVSDNADPTILSSLINSRYIKKVEYNSNFYYIRQFHF